MGAFPTRISLEGIHACKRKLFEKGTDENSDLKNNLKNLAQQNFL